MTDITHRDPRPAETGSQASLAVRLGPLGLGLGLAALLIALYVPLVDGPASAPSGLRRGLGASARPALIVALLTGYSFAASGYARRWSRQALEELRDVIGGPPAAHRARLDAVEDLFDLRRAAVPGGAGGLLGLVIALFTREGPVLAPELAWWGPVVAVLFAQIGRGMFVVIVLGRTFARLGRDLALPDPSDLDALAPFARQGARMAMLWIVGTSIASLLFIDSGAAPFIVACLCVILALACAAVALPLSGVRARIRERKRQDLETLRAAIGRERERLLGEERSAEGSRMAGLLAYREAVASAREWPINATTLARLALYAAVAIGSWLGGALVERALERVLS